MPLIFQHFIELATLKAQPDVVGPRIILHVFTTEPLRSLPADHERIAGYSASS